MSDSPIKFVEGQTVGIDLGTSYSVLSRLGEDGNPEVINNSNDSPITASIVVLGENGKILVGPQPELLAIGTEGDAVDSFESSAFSLMSLEAHKLPPRLDIPDLKHAIWPPLTIFFPSGLKARSTFVSRCPTSVRIA